MLTFLLAADADRTLAQRVGEGLVSLAALWPLWLPLLVGGAAIYMLLPRPRFPWYYGVLAGVAALLVGGALLLPHGTAWEENVLFYAFAAIAVASGVMLVTQQNPARAALSFALVVLATCGLFLLLAAPFLMAATIIVYAGAIVVTFLFVIMLAQQEGRSNADSRSREPLLGTITGFALLAVLLYVIQVGSGPAEVDRIEAALVKAEPSKYKDDDGERIGKVLDILGYKDLRDRNDVGTKEQRAELLIEAKRRYAVERSLRLRPSVPLADLSGPAAWAQREQVRRDGNGVPAMPAENSAYLGKSLFTEYLLPVELGGVLLLVATVGAVAIGQRRARAKPDGDGTLSAGATL